jgi:exosome complex protein LRP1
MYLKAVGLDPADHAVKRELERVALYRTKLDKAAAERRAAGKTARSTVDAAAAGRMVKHALGATRDEPSDASEGERDEEKPKERKRKSETGGKSGGKKKKR